MQHSNRARGAPPPTMVGFPEPLQPCAGRAADCLMDSQTDLISESLSSHFLLFLLILLILNSKDFRPPS